MQAARKEDVLNALSHIASKFRAQVGESVAVLEKDDAPLAEATKPSLEALKAYSAGWKANRSTGSVGFATPAGCRRSLSNCSPRANSSSLEIFPASTSAKIDLWAA